MMILQKLDLFMDYCCRSTSGFYSTQSIPLIFVNMQFLNIIQNDVSALDILQLYLKKLDRRVDFKIKDTQKRNKLYRGHSD